MADARFLVLPSVTSDEMYGISVLEAMAGRRAVITTAAPYRGPELSCRGLRVSRCRSVMSRRLSRALETLVSDRTCASAWGPPAASASRSSSPARSMAERYVALYERVRAQGRK
jgi:glycosyltransferase involved in cell wall biosynthesis